MTNRPDPSPSAVARDVDARFSAHLQRLAEALAAQAPGVQVEIERGEFDFSPRSRGYELSMTCLVPGPGRRYVTLSISLCHLESTPMINAGIGSGDLDEIPDDSSEALLHASRRAEAGPAPAFPGTDEHPDGWAPVTEQNLERLEACFPTFEAYVLARLQRL